MPRAGIIMRELAKQTELATDFESAAADGADFSTPSLPPELEGVPEGTEMHEDWDGGFNPDGDEAPAAGSPRAGSPQQPRAHLGGVPEDGVLEGGAEVRR